MNELKTQDIDTYSQCLLRFEYEHRNNNYSDAYRLGMGWDINTPEKDGDQFAALPSVGEFALSQYDLIQEKLVSKLFFLFNLDKYVIQDREAGNIITSFPTYSEAIKEVVQYELEDHKNGVYSTDFYEIKEVN